MKRSLRKVKHTKEEAPKVIDIRVVNPELISEVKRCAQIAIDLIDLGNVETITAAEAKPWREKVIDLTNQLTDEINSLNDETYQQYEFCVNCLFEKEQSILILHEWKEIRYNKLGRLLHNIRRGKSK